MDIRQLEYFVQVANRGGFNKAAAQLYVAQSALSRQIKLLEEELGVALLVRHGRGVQLTEPGELLLKRAEVLLRNFRQMRDDVAAEGTQPKGELVIGLPPSLDRILTAPLLARMSELHPEVFLTAWVAQSTEIRKMILSGKVDFGVLGFFAGDPVMVAQPLFNDPMYLVGPLDTDYGVAEISCADMSDYPLLLTSRPNDLRFFLEDAALAVGRKLKVIMEVNYIASMVDLARMGVGYGVMSRSALEGSGVSDQVSSVRVSGLACHWSIGVRKDYALSAAARAAQGLVVDILAEHAAQMSEAV